LFYRAAATAAVNYAVGRTPEAVAATGQTGSGGTGPGSQAGPRSAIRSFQVAKDKLRVWAEPSCSGIYLQKRHQGRFAPLSRLRAAKSWWSSPISRFLASSSSFRSSIRSSYDRSKGLSALSGRSGFRSSWVSTLIAHLLPTLLPMSSPVFNRRRIVLVDTFKAWAASLMVICMSIILLRWVTQLLLSGYAGFAQNVIGADVRGGGRSG